MKCLAGQIRPARRTLQAPTVDVGAEADMNWDLLLHPLEGVALRRTWPHKVAPEPNQLTTPVSGHIHLKL